MSNYIMDLRKIVGHRCLIQCAASIIVENEKGQILLGLRSDNLEWGYSGGSIEIDEIPEDCAKRELLEEMGLKALELEYFTSNAGPEAHYIYPNGDEVSNVEIVFRCNKYEGIPHPADGEMLDLNFFDIDDLPKNISKPIIPVIKKYVEYRKNLKK